MSGLEVKQLDMCWPANSDILLQLMFTKQGTPLTTLISCCRDDKIYQHDDGRGESAKTSLKPVQGLKEAHISAKI